MIIENIIGKGKNMVNKSKDMVNYIKFDNPLDKSDIDMNRFRIRGRKNVEE